MNGTNAPALLMLALFYSSTQAATLQGHVHDSRGVVVAGATILVQLTISGQTKVVKTVQSDSKGAYRVSSLAAGSYTVRVHMTHLGEITFGPFLLNEGEARNLDLTLQAPTTSVDFFDEPKFTVAGVTDHTYFGGHGSDGIRRSAEAIAEATASLGKEAPVSSVASADSLKALKQASQLDPGNPSLHRQIAGADENLGNSLEAVREYQRAAELDPSETNLFDWGTELLVHDAPLPAREVFVKGVKLFPRSSRLLIGAGAACYAHGDFSQAAQHFFAATDLNPADPAPYMFLGKLGAPQITATQQYAERVARFAKLEPQNAWAKYLYATTLLAQRRNPDDSEATARVQVLLDEAVRLDPALAIAYLQLGILCTERQDLQTAIQYYGKAIQIDPAMEQAHYRLAQAYRQTGEPQKAQEETAQFQRLSRDSAARLARERSELQRFVVTLKSPGPN